MGEGAVQHGGERLKWRKISNHTDITDSTNGCYNGATSQNLRKYLVRECDWTAFRQNPISILRIQLQDL